MPYQSFTVEQFGGLDLYNDPAEVGVAGAINLSNVDVNPRGQLKTRPGSSLVGATAGDAASQAMAYFVTSTGTEWIVVADPGSTTSLKTVRISDGVAGATQSSETAASNNGFARFGTPAATRIYVATGAAAHLVYFQGGAWTTVTAPVASTLVAVTPISNRLVVADNDTVYFSDAGADTFTSGNSVSLTPGDGEAIKGLVRWRDLLFVFKQTKFFVFYGESVDETDNPIFNYRMADFRHGCTITGQAVAGEEGIYFADTTGIYLTTGNDVRYISQPLEPWLRLGNGPLSLSLGAARLVYHGRRLYVIYPNGSSSVMLVHDPALGVWLVWQMSATAACSVPTSSFVSGLYFAESSTKKAAKVDPTVTTDLGSAFSWSYQSGWYDLGSPERKVIRESLLWGTGSPTYSLLTDYATTDASSAAVTLGTSPTVAEGRQRTARRGVFFSHKLSGTGQATVSRLTHHLTSSYRPGAKPS